MHFFRKLKIENFFLVFLFICFCSCGGSSSNEDRPPVVDPGAVVKIMPLGDSITESTIGYSSYRRFLWLLLTSNGYNVDFVGTKRGVFRGQPKLLDFDQDHEGYWDFEAGDVAERINRIARANPANIVLLHLGTNDLQRNQGVATTIAEVGVIVGALRNANPKVRILLAKIIPSKNISKKLLADYHFRIEEFATANNTNNSPIVVVDQAKNFNLAVDSYDGIHPNDTGDQKMASEWFNSLAEILSQ